MTGYSKEGKGERKGEGEGGGEDSVPITLYPEYYSNGLFFISFYSKI